MGDAFACDACEDLERGDPEISIPNPDEDWDVVDEPELCEGCTEKLRALLEGELETRADPIQLQNRISQLEEAVGRIRDERDDLADEVRRLREHEELAEEAEDAFREAVDGADDEDVQEAVDEVDPVDAPEWWCGFCNGGPFSTKGLLEAHHNRDDHPGEPVPLEEPPDGSDDQDDEDAQDDGPDPDDVQEDEDVEEDQDGDRTLDDQLVEYIEDELVDGELRRTSTAIAEDLDVDGRAVAPALKRLDEWNVAKGEVPDDSGGSEWIVTPAGVEDEDESSNPYEPTDFGSFDVKESHNGSTCIRLTSAPTRHLGDVRKGHVREHDGDYFLAPGPSEDWPTHSVGRSESHASVTIGAEACRLLDVVAGDEIYTEPDGDEVRLEPRRIADRWCGVCGTGPLEGESAVATHHVDRDHPGDPIPLGEPREEPDDEGIETLDASDWLPDGDAENGTKCGNCGEVVNEDYVRVFVPDDLDQPRMCPNCEDLVREGSEVRKRRDVAADEEVAHAE